MAELIDEIASGLRIVVQGKDPIADIIAVPGLGAHPHYTWIKKVPANDSSPDNEQVMWLKDLLPQAIPNARVLKYNYNSNYLINSPKQDLRSISERLINAIHEQRVREPSTANRPIIFIGHSFGGIVVQEAILVAHRDETTGLQYIAQNICGIVFLGTPHRGSSVTPIGKTLTFFASVLNLRPDGQLLDTLKIKSERLHLLLNDFTIVAKTLGVRLVCFYELRETKMMHRYGLGELFKCMVVDRSSATIEGYKSIALDLDHSGLNKFGSMEDEGFRLVSSELKELVKGGQGFVQERGTLASQKKYFLVPYPENKNFTLRDRPYGQLSQLIQDRDSESQLRVAIVGLGGIGKTQIAMRLAYQHKPASNVFWIHGSSRDNFMQNYRQIAKSVGLSVSTDTDEGIIIPLKNWLDSDVSGQWLIIVDNADDLGPDMLRLFRFALPISRGTLLFTTRDSKIIGCGSLVQEGYEIKLSVMNDSEAKATFLKLSGVEICNTDSHPNIYPSPKLNNNPSPKSNLSSERNSAFDQQILVLVDLLGNLPLAISQAASYIKNNQISVTKYIELYRAGEEKQAKLLSDPILVQEQYDGVPKSIMQTWEITLNQLSDDSYRLLQIMSLLNIQNIPRSLVDSDVVRLELRCKDEIDFDRVLKPLLSFSLVNTSVSTSANTFGQGDGDGDRYSYHMHRLVCLWTRKRRQLPIEVIRLALRLLLQEFPNEPGSCPKECYKLLPHALSVISYLEPFMQLYSETNDERNTLQFKIATHYIDVGRFAEAEALLEDCREFYSQRYGHEHEGVFKCMHYLGELFGQGLSNSKALEWFEQALEGRERIIGKNHPSTLETVAKMASIFRRQGKFTKALEWYERVLKENEKSLSKDHPETLSIVNNMAYVFYHQDQLTKAFEWYQRALEGREKVLGKEHPDTLATVSGIALIFHDQRQFTKALEWNKRALEGEEKVLGKEHPSTLISISNIAHLFSEQKQFTEALEWYKRALEGREKVLGKEHPSTLSTVYNIAIMFSEQGWFTEALGWYKRALEGEEKVLGKEHSDTLTTVHNIATVFCDQKQFTEALEWYKRALEGRERVFGKEHPSTLTTVYNIASVFDKQERFTEALEWYQRTLEGEEKVFGKEHTSTLTTVYNIASVFDKQERFTEALEWYQRTLEGEEKVFGKEHTSTLTTVYNIASVFDKQERSTEALEWYKRALEGEEKVLGKEHPDTLTTVHSIAFIFSKQKRFAEALEWYKRALEGREKALGKEHLNTLTTVYNIAFVFSEQKRFAEALEWYKRALEGREKVLGKEHPNTLTTVHGIAFVFSKQKRFAEALEWYKRALEGEEKVLGKEHSDTLTTVHDIASVFSEQKRFTEALEWYKRVLEGEEKVLGKEHPDTLTTVSNMVFILGKQGQHLEALQLYERALAGREKSLWKDHQDILYLMYYVLDLRLRLQPTESSHIDLISRLRSSDYELFTCNHCWQRILGAWYKCRDCDMVDFCGQCFNTSPKPESLERHLEHNFINITTDNEVIVLPKQGHSVFS